MDQPLDELRVHQLTGPVQKFIEPACLHDQTAGGNARGRFTKQAGSGGKSTGHTVSRHQHKQPTSSSK